MHRTSRSKSYLVISLVALACSLPTMSGCSPYTIVGKIGVKVVGDVVNDSDVSQKSQRLIGRPEREADVTFGRRIRTLEDTSSPRIMITYPVYGDALNLFRWAVEVEGGNIVALSKLQTNPDGGADIAHRLMLEQSVIGRKPPQIETSRYFQKRILVLRDRASGDIFGVYDVSFIPDFMGGKYCVLRLDRRQVCREVWIVGVPAATARSSVGNR